MVVELTELDRIFAYLKLINSTPLDKIKWVDRDGDEVKVSEKEIENFRFTGLSNKDFPAFIEII